jgi:hypothetical protein
MPAPPTVQSMVPVGCQAMPATGPARRSAHWHRPLATHQTRTVPSLPAVASRPPSGENAHWSIQLVWPVSTPCWRRSATCHSRTVRSSPVLARVPSGEKAQSFEYVGVPGQRGEFGAAGNPPQSLGLVVAGGGEQSAVGENEQLFTRPVRPMSSDCWVPSGMRHSRTVRSLLAVASTAPSGENAQPVTAAV